MPFRKQQTSIRTPDSSGPTARDRLLDALARRKGSVGQVGDAAVAPARRDARHPVRAEPRHDLAARIVGAQPLAGLELGRLEESGAVPALAPHQLAERRFRPVDDAHRSRRHRPSRYRGRVPMSWNVVARTPPRPAVASATLSAADLAASRPRAPSPPAGFVSTEIVPRSPASSRTFSPCRCVGDRCRSRRQKTQDRAIALCPVPPWPSSEPQPVAEGCKRYPLRHRDDAVEIRVVAQVFDQMAGMEHRRAVAPERRGRCRSCSAAASTCATYIAICLTRETPSVDAAGLAKLLARHAEQRRGDVDHALAQFQRAFVARLQPSGSAIALGNVLPGRSHRPRTGTSALMVVSCTELVPFVTIGISSYTAISADVNK